MCGNCLISMANWMKATGFMDTLIFKVYIRCFISGLNIFPFYLVNYEMIEWMENKMDIWLFKVIFNGLFIMCMISYYIAALKKYKKIP